MLNVRPSKLPDRWVSLERDYAGVERITIGTPNVQFRENGTLTVVVAVRAGTGDAEANTIAERVRNLFHDYAELHLQVTSVSSATVFDPDDGSFFLVKVPVNYFFDFFR